MIKEAYCSFEIAKLLKEKGFDEMCRTFWKDWDHKVVLHNADRNQMFDYCNNSTLQDYCSEKGINIAAPSHQLAMAWLREEHKIVIQIGIKITGASYYYQIWDYSIIQPNKFIGGMIDLRECAENFNSYEDAVEAALRWTLENLI